MATLYLQARIRTVTIGLAASMVFGSCGPNGNDELTSASTHDETTLDLGLGIDDQALIGQQCGDEGRDSPSVSGEADSGAYFLSMSKKKCKDLGCFKQTPGESSVRIKKCCLDGKCWYEVTIMSDNAPNITPGVNIPNMCESGQLPPDLCNGSTGTIITGTDGIDVIHGGPGDDQINPGKGDDHVFGGGGNDTVNGGPGDDVIHGEDGNDTLNGGDGNDVIHGGEGNDNVNGNGGDDTLSGDSLGAEDNDQDTIDGGTGTDTLKLPISGGDGSINVP